MLAASPSAGQGKRIQGTPALAHRALRDGQPDHPDVPSCTKASQTDGETDTRVAAALTEMYLAIILLEMTSFGTGRSRQLRNSAAHGDIAAALTVWRGLADGGENGSAGLGPRGGLGSDLDDITADAVAPGETLAFIKLQDELEQILYTLRPHEQKIIELRFGLKDGQPRTLEEVGLECGVTRERIRQVESKTLAKLRGRRTCRRDRAGRTGSE